MYNYESRLSLPLEQWGVLSKDLAQGRRGDITIAVTGFESVTFPSQMQSPNPHSHTPPIAGIKGCEGKHCNN